MFALLCEVPNVVMAFMIMQVVFGLEAKSKTFKENKR